jgi:hypothetical protein
MPFTPVPNLVHEPELHRPEVSPKQRLLRTTVAADRLLPTLLRAGNPPPPSRRLEGRQMSYCIGVDLFISSL